MFKIWKFLILAQCVQMSIRTVYMILLRKAHDWDYIPSMIMLSVFLAYAFVIAEVMCDQRETETIQMENDAMDMIGSGFIIFLPHFIISLFKIMTF